MGTRNGCQTVHVVELRGDLIAKQPAGTTRADSPSIDVFRIAPHEITERPFVRDLLCSRDDADLVDGSYLGTQATVYAENRAVDDGGQHKEVKNLAACLPDGRVSVLLLALFVEAIHLGDLPRLVVASDQDDPLGVSVRVSAFF